MRPIITALKELLEYKSPFLKLERELSDTSELLYINQTKIKRGLKIYAFTPAIHKKNDSFMLVSSDTQLQRQ